MPTFEIRGSKPYGDFGNAIRRLLPETIIDSSDTGNPAQYTLQLAPESVEKRRVSTAKSALFSEDLITLEIDVQVLQGGEAVLAPIHVSASRLFQDDQSQPTGKGLELQLLKSELREHLARQIVYRLESIDWQKVATSERKRNAEPIGKEPDHAAAP